MISSGINFSYRYGATGIFSIENTASFPDREDIFFIHIPQPDGTIRTSEEQFSTREDVERAVDWLEFAEYNGQSDADYSYLWRPRP